MSIGSIPFHLRPNKHIDRRLFIESLTRLSRLRPVRSYGYISMGGAFLEDARMMYTDLAITRLLSIENDEGQYKRQLFNRPFPFIKCRHMDVAQLVERYDDCIENLDNPLNVIVWLDYQDSKRDSQLAQVREISSVLQAYDIIRVTINANPTSLDEVAIPEDQLAPQLSATGVEPLSADAITKEARLRKLRYQLGDFAPVEIRPAHMTRNRLPEILSQAVYQALKIGIGRELTVQPIGNFAYADQQPMLTVTAAIWPSTDVVTNVDTCDFASWPFYTNDPAKVISINVPTLSTRERTEMDRAVLPSAEALSGEHVAQLEEIFTDSDVKHYQQFQRYYPVFARVTL